MPVAIDIQSAAALERSGGNASEAVQCFHCGTPCLAKRIAHNEHFFCCTGCKTVFELLSENGLTQFYELGRTAGRPVGVPTGEDKFRFLDEPSVRERIVDFADGRQTRITFRLPAIHCVACVWLLENLFRLEPGIGRTTVNFARQEATLTFDDSRVTLSRVAALLESIGYEPDLKLADLDRRGSRISRRLWLQLGVAGFVFGNTMLFSLPAYFGLDSATGPAFRTMVGWISLALSLPVVLFSASDYWRSSWISLRQRQLTLDVPIALGIAALFLQSAVEVVTGRGEGYFDSLAGLLFFLLSGRIFQQKTFERLAFDRDYRSFFPLSISRRRRTPDGAEGEERVALAQVQVGDRLVIRHGELIPADARLVSGDARVDYSFVTGEAEPVVRVPGEILYAGGRQAAGAIEVETLKAVSQSHLTSLWNQDAFRKSKDNTFNTVTNRYSRRFTWIILGIAAAAALFWAVRDPSKSVRSFTGVLIVACPCALALAAPFTLGAAMRVLARRGVFLRNAEVLETLARIDAVVFDKTGTLTAAGFGETQFDGAALSPRETAAIASLARQSTHPLSAGVARWAAAQSPAMPPAVAQFREIPGSGIEGRVDGLSIRLGSASFTGTPETATAAGSRVHVAIDGTPRGTFTLTSRLRPETGRMIGRLSERCQLALLSGDNERELGRFQAIFNTGAQLHFNQSPLTKLAFVRDLQSNGRTVMMVGDGLNDAGALQQSDAGVAVVENIGAFSPASDVILDANHVPRLAAVLDYARRSVRVVRAGFLISTLYNVVGIGIAASGRLSPVVCAILMPLSSATVIAFSCGVTTWLGNRASADMPAPSEENVP